MRPLTARQKECLRFIAKYSLQQGFAPTVREIATAMGNIAVNAAQGHLDSLVKKGRLSRTPGKSRTLVITSK